MFFDIERIDLECFIDPKLSDMYLSDNYCIFNVIALFFSSKSFSASLNEPFISFTTDSLCIWSFFSKDSSYFFIFISDPSNASYLFGVKSQNYIDQQEERVFKVNKVNVQELPEI